MGAKTILLGLFESGLSLFQILRALLRPADLNGNAQRADVAKRNIDCAFQLAIVEPSISDLGVAFKLSGRRLGIHQNGPSQRVAAEEYPVGPLGPEYWPN